MIQEESYAQAEADTLNREINLSVESGYNVIKLSRAYEIPRVALAIKYVTRANWKAIRAAPLVRCMENWQGGAYTFRLFFEGVPKIFQYRHNSAYETEMAELLEGAA